MLVRLLIDTHVKYFHMNKQTKLIILGIVAIVIIVGLVFLRTYLRDRTVSTVVN